MGDYPQVMDPPGRDGLLNIQPLLPKRQIAEQHAIVRAGTCTDSNISRIAETLGVARLIL